MKIDPVQEFPGYNPLLYFTILFFRLNPCRIPDPENGF